MPFLGRKACTCLSYMLMYELRRSSIVSAWKRRKQMSLSFQKYYSRMAPLTRMGTDLQNVFQRLLQKKKFFYNIMKRKHSRSPVEFHRRSCRPSPGFWMLYLGSCLCCRSLWCGWTDAWPEPPERFTMECLSVIKYWRATWHFNVHSLRDYYFVYLCLRVC